MPPLTFRGASLACPVCGQTYGLHLDGVSLAGRVEDGPMSTAHIDSECVVTYNDEVPKLDHRSGTGGGTGSQSMDGASSGLTRSPSCSRSTRGTPWSRSSTARHGSRDNVQGAGRAYRGVSSTVASTNGLALSHRRSPKR